MTPEVAERLRLAEAAAVGGPQPLPMFEAAPQAPMIPAKEEAPQAPLIPAKEEAPQAPMIPAKEEAPQVPVQEEQTDFAAILQKIESWPTNFVRSWIAITKLCNMC